MESYVHCFVSDRSTTRETCSQCRWRKVRCDGDVNSCGNCKRLSLDCSLAAPEDGNAPEGRDRVHAPPASKRPRRLRGSIACTLCREKKVRCSATMPQCSNCRRKGQSCTYPTLKRPIKDKGVPLAESPASLTSSSSGPGISEEMISLVDAFFEHVYPMPSYAFLHPGITKRRCRHGRVHEPLAAAVCAVASVHMGGDRRRASQWADASEQSIWLSLEKPTVPRLQTLLLVIHFRMETGNFQRAFMLAATAARSAAAMRLNYERPELDAIGREVRRRIVWSLKIIERYFSSGLPEFELCPTESMFLEYPGREEDFSQGPPGELGSFSLHVRLETVRRDIMKLTRSVAMLDQPLPSLMKLIRHHEESLAEIGASMPHGTTLSMAQTLDLLDSPWLPRRTLTYASWHQAHCDLYRILLSGYPEAAPAVVLEAVGPDERAAAERHCLHHATSSIQILTTLNQQSTRRQLLEFDTAICSYHATRLLLFISRFGKTADRPAPEFAISRADLCLTALRRFFPSSALVAPIIEELANSIGAFSEQQRLKQSQGRGHAETLLSQQSGKQSARQSQLESTARIRQHLAIHSLLRRADFSDDDADDVDQDETVVAEADRPEALPGDQPVHEGTDSAVSLSSNDTPNSSALFPEISVQEDIPSWESQSAAGYPEDGPESLYLPMSWYGAQDWDWLSVPTS